MKPRFLLLAAAALVAAPLFANSWPPAPTLKTSRPKITSESMRQNVQPLDITGTDPIGDAPAGMPDITSLSAIHVGSDLVITLTFADTIVAPPTNQPNTVIGYIDLDTDQNTATGLYGGSIIQEYCGVYDIGVDYLVSFFGNGTAHVETYGGGSVDTGSVVYGSNTVTITIPLADLGGDDGNVNFDVIVGNLPQPTDCASAGAAALGFPNTPALGPLGLAFLAIALGALAIVVIRR